MIMKVVSTAFLLAAVVTFSCGGGQEEKTSMMEQSQGQVQQRQAPSTFAWENLPIPSEAVPAGARMMPGNQQYEEFEIRFFKSPQDSKTILEFFKKEIPQKGWAFAEETKLDKGLQERWEAKTNTGTIWVRVTQGQEAGETDIEIIYGKKKR